jgi:hypothetical protein
MDKRAYRAASGRGFGGWSAPPTCWQGFTFTVTSGQDASAWIWLEGTREKKRMFEIGNAAAERPLVALARAIRALQRLVGR